MPGIVESHHLAAGAEEDRAALSGRPRKANAGQYATVMPQRPAQKRKRPDVSVGARFASEVFAADQRLILSYKITLILQSILIHKCR